MLTGEIRSQVNQIYPAADVKQLVQLINNVKERAAA